MDGSRMLPAISVDSFSFNINKDKVSVKIYGSLTADIANLFVQIFQDLVLDIIMNQVNDKAPEVMTKETNEFFLDRHGIMVLDQLNGLAFDYAYTSPPVISDYQLDMFFNATFFNSKLGEHNPGEGIADLDIDTTTRGQVQIDVSRYTIESFLLTLYESEKLTLLLDGSRISESKEFSFDTTTFEEYLPGLVDKYGDAQPMELFLRAAEMPKVVFQPDEMSTYWSFLAEFRVVGVETAVILAFQDVMAVYDLSLEDFLLYLHFDSLSVGNIYIEDTKIGAVDTASMLKNVNRLLKLALPLINTILSSGFEIPQHYFSRTEVADASFTSFYNYVKIQWEPYIQETIQTAQF
mmetsp:Transcript_17151/g.12259  ORF Transcript_17151/g.12259 Transcript_17151/m.12259 type:complete len:350 (-) Transcript_17151:35-1084(-)|eukprot:CAMPEP_0202955822 /NCGR_PEP_ID=MMETSP1396-20130829/330_1 /ASSEMBLY_ACC=CAM_ASM_000872 /TAXON_ID= /ORGANISM="Pseudokeronopsis sp., Strain Brazil" /LENGTH=349 /DNA_ID=CAMNT_0049672533 /DNA_START=399 /DNA_END=1448 /DNA_ORIENTATION=-